MSKSIKLQLIILQKHMVHEICIMFFRNFCFVYFYFFSAVHVKDRSDLHINEKLCRLACWEVSQRLNLMPEACVQTFSHTATNPPHARCVHHITSPNTTNACLSLYTGMCAFADMKSMTHMNHKQLKNILQNMVFFF